MGARITDPLDSARRWLEDCLTSAKRWEQTEAPARAPAYLPQVICERLRASVRMVRQLRRQLARAQQEEADALEEHAELARALRRGPVTRGHRNNMRRVSAKAQRANAQATFHLEGLSIAKGNLKAAAERVQKSIEAAGARLNGEQVNGRPMPRQAAEIQAEREASRREALAKLEEGRRLEQEKRDALVAIELARTAKNRAAAVQVALKLAKPAGYPCATCAHGKAQPASETGWECVAALARACKPWTHEPERWVARA